MLSAFAKKIEMLSAILGPISGMAMSSASVACAKTSRLKNSRAKVKATFSPTSGMPSAVISLSKALCLLLAIASTREVAERCPRRGNVKSCGTVRLYKSAASATSLCCTKLVTTASPRPAMSMADFDAK